MATASQDASHPSKVPVRRIVMWTLPWVTGLVALLAMGTYTDYKISYEVCRNVRRVAFLVLVGLAIWGLLLALKIAGSKREDPWYTVALLVALVLFWGLFPPSWFFTEYYLLDQGTFGMPKDVAEQFAAAADKTAKETATMTAKQTEIKAAFLASTKVYADLASKVWLAVGAALATAVGLSR